MFRSPQFLLFLLNGATNYLTRARLVARRVLTNQLGLRYNGPNETTDDPRLLMKLPVHPHRLLIMKPRDASLNCWRRLDLQSQ